MVRRLEIQRLMGALCIAGGAGWAASTPGLAQALDGSEKDEIVVTGERVERSLRETAASVAVLDEARLSKQAGADRLDQVLDFVANLQRGASDIAPTIRGQDTTGVLIGANAFLGGTRPRATLQIDGRALNFNEFVYGLSSIWDVERIEVFRGPQTTTQGRNAIAGAIFIKTKDPTFDFEGAGQLVFGNEETRQASVAFSGPVIEDQVAARIAVDFRRHESWVNYTAPDVFIGANREDDDYTSARAKLLFTPEAIPGLEVLLTYAHLEANNPQNETSDEPYEDRVQIIQNGAQWDTNVDSVVVKADYSFTDGLAANLTGSFADSRSERFAAPGFGTAVINADEYAIESVLQFDPPAGRLRGLMGVSYFAANQDETSDLSAFLGFGNFTDRQRSLGVLGEATLDVTPRLHVTIGGRWQQDQQERVGALGFAALDYDETFDAFLPKAEVSFDVTDDVVIGATARRGFNPGGTTISFVTGDIDEFGQETLWSYELFSRASLFDNDLVLSTNLFFTKFTDAQRPLITFVTLPGGGTAETTQFANAPSAESYGLEFEGVWSANDYLQIRATIGYLETEITETLRPNDPILGQEFQRAPRISGTLGLSLQPVEPLTLDLSARYNTSYFSDDANTPAFKIDSRTILDAKATYDFGPVSAFAFVRNATDKTYQVWQFRPGNSSLGDPREFGGGLQARF